ncbi:MAG: ABC transporter permease [Planctomycetes bacterium]|nr:ABC transporter permease [Planctomycetota bacterium]
MAVRSLGRAPRSSRTMGWLGGVVLVVMVLGCLATLPYTLGKGRAADSGRSLAAGTEPRRYEATNLDQALLPPFWSRHAPDERQRAESSPQPPRHLLGSDRLGRDLLTRCLAGGGISLGIGLAAACIAVVIGTAYGALAGYLGGRIDGALMRIVDVVYGLPYILLVVLLAVAVDGLIERWGQDLSPGLRQAVNVVTLLVAIGGVSWLTLARVIRGQVLTLKQQPFMEAARAVGVPLGRQFTRHLLPNLLGPIIVYATLTVPAAILSESFLSFLGIGVREPLPSWGNLAADGLSELNTVRVRWWLLVWPSLFIATTLLALNFVGEALREALDPKRRAVAVV